MIPRPTFTEFPFFPHSAELSYKHPYWWDDDYARSWIIWRYQGMIGPEPEPKAESRQTFYRGTIAEYKARSIDFRSSASTPSTTTQPHIAMPETSSPKKVFKATLETYEEGPNQSYGPIRDRVTLESFGCDLPEIKEMRKPFAAAQEALNQGDTE